MRTSSPVNKAGAQSFESAFSGISAIENPSTHAFLDKGSLDRRPIPNGDASSSQSVPHQKDTGNLRMCDN